MTTNPPDGLEPADLSELTATDALLDRLGARSPSEEDLLDPMTAALAGLLAEVDAEHEPDADLARLVEVLAGRPLYVGEPTASPAGVPSADDGTRVIDLTGLESSDSDEASAEASMTDESSIPDIVVTLPAAPELVRSPDVSAPDAAVPDVAAMTPAPDPAPSLLIPLIPAQGRRLRRFERVVSHLSLPAAAAAVILLVALGGGVTAAVTGNPMAPVDGVSQVVAKLPGVDNSSERRLKHAKGELSAASQALENNDTHAARNHLGAAQRDLPDVPEADKPALGNLITDVETALNTHVPTTPTPTIVPTTGSVDPVTTTPPMTPKPKPKPTPATATPTPSTSSVTTAPVTPSALPTTTPPEVPTSMPTSPQSVIDPPTITVTPTPTTPTTSPSQS
jgi:hypothetical protein